MTKKSETSLQEAMQKLPFAEYSRLLSEVELISIQLSSINADYKHPLTGIDYETSFDMSHKHKYVKLKKEIRFSVRFHLAIDESGQDSDAQKNIDFDSSFEIVLKADSDVPEEFMVIYENYTLPLNVWPYIRECVANTLYRMGVPPVTLPLLKTVPDSK